MKTTVKRLTGFASLIVTTSFLAQVAFADESAGPQNFIDQGFPVKSAGVVDGIPVYKMDDDTAYELTKTFWDSKAKLGDTSPWWNGVDPAMLSNINGKIHPGALRYYEEAGYPLTDAQK